MSSPAQFQARDVPIDPYALGLLLGDGCLTTSTTPSFSTSDPELATALRHGKQKTLRPRFEQRIVELDLHGLAIRADDCQS